MDDDEIDKLTEENAELQRKLFDQEIEQAEDRTKRAFVKAVRKKGNIIDIDAAYKLLDLSEVDSEKPETISRALDKLVIDKPFLIGRTGPPPTPGVGGPPLKAKKDPNQRFAEMLRRGVARTKGY